MQKEQRKYKLHNQQIDRLRLIFEECPFAIQVFDAQGNCLAVNKSWALLWNASPEDVKKYNILNDPQIKKIGIFKYFEKAFKGERAVIPAHYYDPIETGVSGRGRWIKTLLYPLLNNDNKLIEVVLILEDVTGLKESEELLKEKNNELEKMNKLMVGREIRMANLKKEIQSLRESLRG